MKSKYTSSLLEKIAQWIYKHPWIVIVTWLVVFFLSVPKALHIESVLSAGSGATGTEANVVKKVIKNHFDFPFVETYVIALESNKYNINNLSIKKIVEALKSLLEKEQDTLKVVTYYDLKDPIMKSKDGSKTFVLVGQKRGKKALELRVPEIRSNIAKEIDNLKKIDSTLKVYFVSGAAVAYDMHIALIESTKEVEKQTLVITLVLLLIAFRSFTGALLPILMAIFSNTIGMAIIFIIAQFVSVAAYAQSIATMLGLAVGIDYSLLIVWRYREKLEQTKNEQNALIETVITAGNSIFFSGFVVLIGFSGLIFTGIEDIYSIAIGGTIVVFVSVMLSLTFVPAVLSLLGEKIDFPKFLSKSLSLLTPAKFWQSLSYRIMKTPGRFFIIAFCVILIMSLPTVKMKTGEFDVTSVPSSLESRKGIDILTQMSVSGIISPIQLLASSTENDTILNIESLKALKEFCKQLKSDKRIAQVQSITDFLPNYNDKQLKLLLSETASLKILYPELFEYYISTDFKYTIVQIIPKNAQNHEEIAQLYYELQNEKIALKEKGVSIQIGGVTALAIEYSKEIVKNLPQIIVGVIIVTYLVLLIAFRSFLLPLKAIILNIFSVLVSYGVLVLVFQYGIIPGIATSSIMIFIPVLLFCIVFGLSMDYEVFLMTRIQEEYYNGSDNETATIKGISATGDVITYAALMMCVVFSIFAMVELTIIRQLGLGLAVAIFIDATIVRMIMVPAFMKIAGTWNWYPGNKARTKDN